METRLGPLVTRSPCLPVPALSWRIAFDPSIQTLAAQRSWAEVSMAPSSRYGGWGPLPAFQTPFTADRPKRPPHLACNMRSSYRDQLHPQAAGLNTQNCGTGVARCYSYSYSNQATVEAQTRFITINKGKAPQHCRLSKQLQTKPLNN